MKGITTFALVLGLAGMTLAGLAFAEQKDKDLSFARAKSGLLMSPGVIELIRKEGEIALDDERITCQRIERTGSHLRETYCLTLPEAELARQRNQQTMWRFLQGAKR